MNNGIWLELKKYLDLLFLQFNIFPGTPGHYTATISGSSVIHSGGSWFRLYMYLNGQRVDETRITSGYIHDNGHDFYDQGSRTMVSHNKLSITISV